MLLALLLAWSRGGRVRAHILLLAAGRCTAILRHSVISGAASINHRRQGGAIVDAIGLGIVRDLWVVLFHSHKNCFIRMRPLKQVSHHYRGHNLLEHLVCTLLHLHLSVAVALHSLDGLVQWVLSDERTTAVALVGLDGQLGDSFIFMVTLTSSWLHC